MTRTQNGVIPGYAGHHHPYEIECDEDGTTRLVFPDWACDCPHLAWDAWRFEIRRCIKKTVLAAEWLDIPSDDYPVDGETLRDDLFSVLYWSRALASLLDAEPPHVRPELAAREEQTI